MSDKIYYPEIIDTYPLPEVQSEQHEGSTNYVGKTNIQPGREVDVRFPVKQIARETLSEALNTRTKQILGEFTFGEIGAISIGTYENGESGDIRLTPNGITARDVNGVTTFSLDGTTGDAVFKGTVSAGSVVVGYARGWVSTLVWTATDYNTASWAAGNIRTSGGTTYNIASGNTGNISAKTYVYLDPDTSTTVLQKSTTYSDAVGDKIILVAIVEPGASGSKCVITVVNSSGTTIDGDRIVTGKIESSDGKTYFDLDNDVIVISDDGGPRVVIGEV